MTDAPRNQEQRILWLLQSAWPNWVPAPELARISLQYSARIFSLRRKGWLICNRVDIVGGVKHGSFRLGSKPVPRSAELRRSETVREDGQNLTKTQALTQSLPTDSNDSGLLFEIAPDRSYRE